MVLPLPLNVAGRPLRRTPARLVRRAALVCVLVPAALGAPSAALASSAGQSISGLTLETLSLSVPTPVALSGLQPGSTSTGTGSMLVLSTKGSWSLSVQDNAAGTPGHMVAAWAGCSGSESSLLSPLTVDVTGTGVLGSVSSSGAVAISGSAQSAASGTGVLGTAVLTTSYSQSVASSESLLTGCSYGLTATYTLQ
jgi:hypothetical protein